MRQARCSSSFFFLVWSLRKSVFCLIHHLLLTARIAGTFSFWMQIHKEQTKHVTEVTEIYFVTTARTHKHYYKKHPEICFLSFESSCCCPIHKEIAFNVPLQSHPDSQPSKDRTADIPSGGIWNRTASTQMIGSHRSISSFLLAGIVCAASKWIINVNWNC